VVIGEVDKKNLLDKRGQAWGFKKTKSFGGNYSQKL